jgi:hypothetical protein
MENLWRSEEKFYNIDTWLFCPRSPPKSLRWWPWSGPISGFGAPPPLPPPNIPGPDLDCCCCHGGRLSRVSAERSFSAEGGGPSPSSAMSDMYSSSILACFGRWAPWSPPKPCPVGNGKISILLLTIMSCYILSTEHYRKYLISKNA